MNIIIETGKKEEFYPIKKIKDSLYKISWDLKNIGGSEYSWKYCTMNYIPSINNIKKIIEDDINKYIQNSIINKFYWNDMKVNLEIDNQIDYKLLYDSSIILDGENLPEIVKFKKNNEDIYYEFTSLEDLQDFILCMNEHIRKYIKLGYEKKNAVNYLDYKL